MTVHLYEAHGPTAGASGAAAGLVHPYTAKGSLLWMGLEGLAATQRLVTVAKAALDSSTTPNQPLPPQSNGCTEPAAASMVSSRRSERDGGGLVLERSAIEVPNQGEPGSVAVVDVMCTDADIGCEGGVAPDVFETRQQVRLYLSVYGVALIGVRIRCSLPHTVGPVTIEFRLC